MARCVLSSAVKKDGQDPNQHTRVLEQVKNRQAIFAWSLMITPRLGGVGAGLQYQNLGGVNRRSS
jgi:hypothetical protein